METTKIRFGFKGTNQLPLFCLWREYWQDGEVIFAKTLLVIYCPWDKRRLKKAGHWYKTGGK